MLEAKVEKGDKTLAFVDRDLSASKLESLEARLEARLGARLEARFEARFEEQKRKFRVEIESLRNQHKVELDSMKAKMGLIQTARKNTTNDINNLLWAEMKTEREASKTDIGFLKAEVESMKTDIAKLTKDIDTSLSMLSSYIPQYKNFAAETEKKHTEAGKKQKDDHATAGKELDDVRAKHSSRIEDLEQKLTLQSKKLDTEAASSHQAIEVSKSAKQLSEANQHSIQSLNARYNNLNTEQLARHIARVLQPLPASIQAEHTVLQRRHAELRAKVDGIQSVVVDKQSQPLQEVQQLKGVVEELHRRQDLILGVITDGEIFDENGNVSLESVTRDKVSRLVKGSVLQTVEGSLVTMKRQLYEQHNVNFSKATEDAFGVLMVPKMAQLTEHIEDSVKNIVQDKIDNVALPSTSSSHELQNEVHTLQVKFGDLCSDLEGLTEQVNEIERRVMLVVFGGDMKNTTATIVTPPLDEKVTRSGSKPASTPATTTTCKRHNIAAKRGVRARSQPFDQLNEAWLDGGVPTVATASTTSTTSTTTKSAVDSHSTEPRRPLNSQFVLDAESRWSSSNSSPGLDAGSGPMRRRKPIRKRQKIWHLSTESEGDNTLTIGVSTTQRPHKKRKGT